MNDMKLTNDNYNNLGLMRSSVGSTTLGTLLDFGINELNYFRQKKLQDKLMQREDTAIQRRVNDLTQAGLNPLLSAGSPASTGIMSSVQNNADTKMLQGEISDWLKNNYEAQKEAQQVAVENAYQELGLKAKEFDKKEAEIELLEAQKKNAEAMALESISQANRNDVASSVDAYNLALNQMSGTAPGDNSLLTSTVRSTMGATNLFIEGIKNMGSAVKNLFTPKEKTEEEKKADALRAQQKAENKAKRKEKWNNFWAEKNKNAQEQQKLHNERQAEYYRNKKTFAY